MDDSNATPRISARERLLDASYHLFLSRGVNTVGVNEIVLAAGVAKASFYSNFASKNDLILAFLERRRSIFTVGHLTAEAERRGSGPEQRLLAIFNIFDEWFQDEDFTGCPYIRALVEAGPGDIVGTASAGYLQEMRDQVQEVAELMHLTDAKDFAECWMILLQGSVVAALGTGYTSPGRVRRLGELLLDSHRAQSPKLPA